MNNTESAELPFEKTCGSVLYAKKDGKKKFLLIKSFSGHTGFPKGHVEQGETEEQTAVREVFEETGINVKIDPATRQEYTYITLSHTRKNCVYFCNEVTMGEMENAKIQQEEIVQSWIADYDEAMKLLNFPEDREILERAVKFND